MISGTIHIQNVFAIIVDCVLEKIILFYLGSRDAPDIWPDTGY
jgi:hypothetical protein